MFRAENIQFIWYLFVARYPSFVFLSISRRKILLKPVIAERATRNGASFTIYFFNSGAQSTRLVIFQINVRAATIWNSVLSCRNVNTALIRFKNPETIPFLTRHTWKRTRTLDTAYAGIHYWTAGNAKWMSTIAPKLRFASPPMFESFLSGQGFLARHFSIRNSRDYYLLDSIRDVKPKNLIKSWRKQKIFGKTKFVGKQQEES